jgi:very-short-patch-repair endonuclease
MSLRLPLSLYEQCALAKLPRPEPEFRFHPTRRWRFDRAWPDKSIAVEVDGAVYTGGRHTRGAGFEKDMEKLNEAQILGWRVLRFSSGMVKDGRALGVVERLLRA